MILQLKQENLNKQNTDTVCLYIFGMIFNIFFNNYIKIIFFVFSSFFFLGLFFINRFFQFCQFILIFFLLLLQLFLIFHFCSRSLSFSLLTHIWNLTNFFRYFYYNTIIHIEFPTELNHVRCKKLDFKINNANKYCQNIFIFVQHHNQQFLLIIVIHWNQRERIFLLVCLNGHNIHVSLNFN